MRIELSIRELGFRPNQLARAFQRQRSTTIAIVVPNISHVLYPLVARGASEVLRPAGLQVAVYDTDGMADVETQVMQSISDRRAGGAIVFGYALAQQDALMLEDTGIPLVNGGLNGDIEAPWDVVLVDQAGAVRSATVWLSDRYHGPIGYIGGPVEHGSSAVREAGYRDAIEARRADPAPMVVATAYSAAAGHAAMLELLARADRVRAVVCANDLLAIGAIAALRESGLSVPGDVAVTGYDNTDAAEMAVPPLTTVDAFAAEQGRTCARLLLDRMDGTFSGPPRKVRLQAELVVRESA